METILSKYWFLVGAIWFTVNGILHDVFVIKGHKGGYDRELLRLLMDGHVLIFSGLMMGAGYLMARNNMQFAAIVSLITAISMLVYCGMIFPFLKSIVTMVISAAILIVSIAMLSQQ